jgi:hypothetical protein
VQALVVYVVVAIAALYVGWRFMPAALRWRLAARIGALARRRGLARERVVWLEAKLNSGGACGSCNSCNACGTDERADVRTAARRVPNATRLPESQIK